MADFLFITAIVCDGGVLRVVIAVPFITVVVGESGVWWIMTLCWGISHIIIDIISVVDIIYKAMEAM